MLRNLSVDPSDSVSPVASCFQEFIVAREHKMCWCLVSRKGNQEYGPVGARFVLLDQAPDQIGMVENSTELHFKEGPSLDRAWSQGRVPKGSSLCADTLGTEIRRPGRFGFRDSRSSQGPTDQGVSRPCSGGRTVTLQITGSHTSGQGESVHRSCPLQSQRDNGQAPNDPRGSSHAQVRCQTEGLHVQLGCRE